MFRHVQLMGAFSSSKIRKPPFLHIRKRKVERFTAIKATIHAVMILTGILILSVSTACNAIPIVGYGPPAPWPTLLAAAQNQAYNVDKEAVLRSIFVDVLDNPPKSFDYNRPLELRFDFVRPNGHAVEVKLRDTDPPSVLNVDSTSTWGGFIPTDDEKKLFAQDLASVKLGPREIYQKVVAEGQDYDQPPGILMLFSIYDRYKLWTGKTIVWDVQFDDYPTKELRLLLDVETGQVLDRQHGPPPVTPTP